MARQRMRRKVRKFAKAALSAATTAEARTTAKALFNCETLEEAQAIVAPAPAPVPAAEPAVEPKAKPKAKGLGNKIKKALSKDEG